MRTFTEMLLLTEEERMRVLSALHLLMARVHLDAAGIRKLNAEEEYTLYQVSQWYSRTEKREAQEHQEAPDGAVSPVPVLPSFGGEHPVPALVAEGVQPACREVQPEAEQEELCVCIDPDCSRAHTSISIRLKREREEGD